MQDHSLASLRSVDRWFGSHRAVQNVSFAVDAGAIVGVLGANGAGKSTLMKLIAGWFPVSAGEIRIGDSLIKPNRSHSRRKALLLVEPQSMDAAVLRELGTVLSDYNIDRASIEQEAADWFERFGILSCYSRNLRELSRGQQFKVSLVGLFLIRPLVWLLDEPYACGLDAEGIAILEQEIKSHVAGGGVVFFSTQWPAHARHLASEVMVLDEGKLVHHRPISDPVDESLLASAPSALRAVIDGINDNE